MPRRTKEWWARLDKWERAELVAIERGDKRSYRSSFYPDDCGACGCCDAPSLGGGLCRDCNARLMELLRKADGPAILSLGRRD